VPLVAQLAISRAVGADQPAYRVHGATATDPRQGLSFHFSSSGVAVSAAGGSAELGLQGRPVTPSIRGNRVTYRRGAVSEWYANGPLGLEQGFTLAKGAPDVLRLSAGGTLRARIIEHGSGLLLVDAHGRATLRERYLSAWDAGGKSLPVRFVQTAGGALSIRVNLQGAAFPVTIDPLVQAAVLNATDEYAYEGDGAGVGTNGISAGGFGSSVALDGQTIAVGAPGAPVTYGPGQSSTYPDGVTNSYQGAVYVFTEPSGGWADATQTAKLVASDGQGAGASVPSGQNVYGDALGSSVAISGNTIVAGAPRAVAGGQSYAGKLYVFTEPASGGWVNSFQTAELAASNASVDDFLGASVAFDGQTIVSAVPNRNYANAASAAYVFAKPSSGTWISATQTAEIHDPPFSSNDNFGASVAVSGNTIAIGAPYTTDGAVQDAGAVYTFTDPGTGWTSALTEAKLVPASPVTFETVGESVALDGSTLVTGAPHYVGNGGPKPSGAAYVFTDGSSWSAATQARLTASDGTTGDSFGASVNLAGASVYVTGYPSGIGNLYQFTKPAAGWASATQTSEASLTAAGVGPLAIQGTTIVAGAPEASDGSKSYAGAALVLTTTTGTTTTGTTTTGTTTTGTGTTTTGTGTTTTGTGTTTTGTGTTTTGTGTTTTGTGTTTTPSPTTFQAPAGGTLNYTSTPEVIVTVSTADIIAGLFGLTPGSGETENLGEFTFVAYCSKPQGQCAAGTSFGQQLGTVTAAGARVSHAKKKPKAIIYGSGRISIPAGKHGKVTVKLTALGRKLLQKNHVLRGTLLISLGTTGSGAHRFTLRYKPKAKARKH
jgi:hypothetical protein